MKWNPKTLQHVYFITRACDVTSHDAIRSSQPSEDPVDWCEAQALSRNVAAQLSEDDHKPTLNKEQNSISV